MSARRPGGAASRPSARVPGPARPVRPPARPGSRSAAESILGPDTSLLDVLDNVLNKGVVLTGEVTIALAGVDLVYARLSLLLCAADRVLPREPPAPPAPHRGRAAAGARAIRA